MVASDERPDIDRSNASCNSLPPPFFLFSMIVLVAGVADKNSGLEIAGGIGVVVSCSGILAKIYSEIKSVCGSNSNSNEGYVIAPLSSMLLAFTLSRNVRIGLYFR